MNSPDPSTYEDLAARFLEDDLDEAGRAELGDLLKAEPSLRARLSRDLAMTQALTQLRPDHDEDSFARDMSRHVVQIANEGEDDFLKGVTSRITRTHRTRWLAAAASIALIAAATFLLVPSLRGGAAAVARLVQIDASGQVVSTRDIGHGFKNTIGSGFCRLDFANGATLAIEAPASFEVLSPTSLRIHSGKLNAWCPESAHGFQVLTSSAKVTDLGTSFCVSARNDGSADYVVLDGQIEVSTKTDTRRLTKGNALASDLAANLSPLVFQPREFSRTWPLASGILSTSGSVQPAPPGTPEQLAGLENNESVMVVPERRDVPFNTEFPAELVDPGEFPTKNGTGTHTVAARPGTRLGSYLIRYNPVKNPDYHWERFEGEVTFDRPVVAICALGTTLDSTDTLFATGSWKLANKQREYRGIDLDQPPNAPDRVTLSADRRTVHILFNAAISTDEVRVLIEEAPVNLP